MVVRNIHSADRFNVAVHTQNQNLTWTAGGALDFWSATVTLANNGTGHSCSDGEYLYRYQLLWTPAAGSSQLVTSRFPDLFDSSTDIGLMSATVLSTTPAPFQ